MNDLNNESILKAVDNKHSFSRVIEKSFLCRCHKGSIFWFCFYKPSTLKRPLWALGACHRLNEDQIIVRALKFDFH